ncbi:MAG TPA: S16 family serine protease, partial [Thermoanaerobaculia bacterium]|nr:S16 family serine protease [Thermoanaerobaculia bacterium]
PDDARAVCELLARRFQGKERELDKLSILAGAFIAELSGEKDEACRVLEELGNERGFETDTDRILALARLYEESGQREKLEKAAHICEYLERHVPKASILGRLASLYQALGREEEAAEYRARFLRAFRKRMFRPSLDDIARVAAERYLPLAKLLAIRLPPEAFERAEGGDEPVPDEGVARRRAAIRAAFEGGLAAAATPLAQGNDAIDLAYRADLLVMEGREDEATSLYLASFASRPAEERVLLPLLSRAFRGDGSPREAVRDALGGSPLSSPLSDRARQTLEAALKAAPRRPSLWRALAALHLLRGESEDAAACEKRASLLDEAAARKDRAVGRSLAAAVYHFIGRPKGLIHEVWAGKRPTAPGTGGHLEDVLGNVTPEMAQSVRNVFLSAREYARDKLPHLSTGLFDHVYSYKITKEDEPSGGLSAGLPTALAFLSVFIDRPLPQDVASSGALVADAHDVLVVKGVGEAEHKARGGYNRNLRMLLLPRENRQNLRESPLVPPAVCGEMVRYVADLDEAATLVFGDDIWS